MARKTETITRNVDVGGTLTPVTLTFRRFLIKQEDQFSDWLRKLILRRARESMQATCPSSMWPDAMAKVAIAVSGGACSLTGQYGPENALSGDGMRKFLQIAASEDHPEITEETIQELIYDDVDECQRVVIALMPTSAKMQAALNGPETK